MPDSGKPKQWKLLVQPGDGIMPLIKGIAAAKSSVDIVIFRADRKELESALAAAVGRGVSVHALIAHTNRAGEENLRRLELRLLESGITVARTAGDLVRYHSKFMIVDRRELYLLAFNFTYADMERSRSFGVITTNRPLVREAVKLFEADTRRQPYEAGLDQFVVSPANARKQLSSFIQGAKQRLIMYDPNVGDPAIISLLQERAKAGVAIRLIGRLVPKSAGIAVHKLAGMRLHTRTMVRDNDCAFVGSQSLRTLELDARREAGVILRDPEAVAQLVRTFEEDWERAELGGGKEEGEPAPAARVAKKVAKAVAKELPPLAAVLDGAVKEVAGGAQLELNAEEVERVIKEAVRSAVKDVVQDAMEEIAQQSGEGER